MMIFPKFQLCLWAMCISFEGLTVPFPPRNVTIEVATHHVIVTWDPPIEPNDESTVYVVSYSILPDLRVTMNYVTDGSRFSLIPVEGREGRLFKIQVQAQNQVGLGNPSAARYARIGCGKTLWLNPSASTSLIYPETEGNYNTGVLCQWTLSTKDTCFLWIMFVTLQLMVPDNKPCIEDYVTIGNKGHFCHAQEEEKIVAYRDSNATVTFNSDIWAPGKRFHLMIMSIKLPGPPSLSNTLSSDNAIILTWSPPTGLTLPLSAYVIRYSILPDGPSFSKVMEPSIFQFSIDTRHFEGKVILMNVTARIYDVEGVTSNSLKVRAECQRNIVLEPNGETDIYSPNYPDHYPAGIICTWRIRAKRDVPLSVKFLDFQLEDNCTGDYITISTYPDEKFCGAIEPFWTLESDAAALEVAFFSNDEGQKSGFHLQVLARVKPPGPPTSFTVKSNENDVILKWQPPTLVTMPITSYVVRYSVLPDGPTVIRYLEPNLFYFSIGTKPFEGKIILMNVTARIYDVEGVTSNLLKVRAQCQRNIVLEPNGETDIYSPNYPNHYPAGTICTWNIRAKKDVPLSFKFLDFQLEDSYRCRGDYVTISTNPDEKFCGAIQPFWTLETDAAALEVAFFSNDEDQKSGFHLQVLARVKPPGPPTSFTVESNENNVILKWQPPTLVTMPITSYVVRYSVLPDGPTVIRHLEPNLFYFSIDTKPFEGKIILMNVTARIYDVEGVTTNSLNVRAHCHKNIVLEPNGETDIFSPNYPNHYPAGTICTWNIQANRELILLVKFVDFHLRDKYPCSNDYILVSIKPYERFCDIIQPSRTLETHAASFDVTFVSDNEDHEGRFHLQVLAKGTSTFTAVQTQGGQNGLRKNIIPCILNCLYSVIDAIWHGGFLTTVFGGFGTIAATAVNLIWDYYWGENWNFIERAKEYVLEWIGISSENLRLYRVVRSCTECFW